MDPADREQERLRRRRASARFNRRKRGLQRKADELQRLCEADVFVLIRRNSQYHVFTSIEDPSSWPPSMQHVVSIHLGLKQPWSALTVTQEQSYPLPEILTPQKLAKKWQKGNKNAGPGDGHMVSEQEDRTNEDLADGSAKADRDANVRQEPVAPYTNR